MTRPRPLFKIILSCLAIMAVSPVPAHLSINIEGEQLNEITHAPSWLIMVYNLDDGSMVPWLYDFRATNNHWTVFPQGRNYQVIASELSFNNHTTFHNFCNIQDGILTATSLEIYLSGQLTPDTQTIRCKIVPFPAA